MFYKISTLSNTSKIYSSKHSENEKLTIKQQIILLKNSVFYNDLYAEPKAECRVESKWLRI